MSRQRPHQRDRANQGLKDGEQDWETPCEVCGAKPTMYPTGLCGPCCTGEAETVNGNW